MAHASRSPTPWRTLCSLKRARSCACGPMARGGLAQRISPCVVGSTCRDYLGSKCDVLTWSSSAATADERCCAGDVLPHGQRRKQAVASRQERRCRTRLAAAADPSSWEHRRARRARTRRPTFSPQDDIATWSSPPSWEVHYNSNRTGVRLIGPKPQTWARPDGGEAGLHPVQHSRQRLCHRRHRLYRRHAGDPGAGWSLASAASSARRRSWQAELLEDRES